MRRALRAGAALALGCGVLLAAAPGALAAGDGPGSRQLDVQVVIPGDGLVVTDAQLVWAVNLEAGGGAYAGGCNFLSAGVAGDAGRSRVWAQDDGLYAATDGAVRIEKPDASGAYVAAGWDTRCLDGDGVPVTASSTASSSGNRVAITGGRGTVDRVHGTATVRWEGSFTVAFYGGMTYWSATDPVLTVAADGTGSLTATASGYGASMADPGAWRALAPATVTLARLTGVELGVGGFAATPAYLGVPVEVPAGVTAQAARDEVNAPYWGSFPQDFVDFQVSTGQASYWYTSNGARDRAKPPLPVVVSYDASEPVDAPPAPQDDGSTGTGGTGGTGGGGDAVRPQPPAPAPVTPSTPPETPPAEAVPPAATAASTVLAAAPLIPSVPAARPGPLGDPLVVWSAAGVLALGALATAGFLKGWLVLPWAR